MLDMFLSFILIPGVGSLIHSVAPDLLVSGSHLRLVLQIMAFHQDGGHIFHIVLKPRNLFLHVSLVTSADADSRATLWRIVGLVVFSRRGLML